MTDAINHQHSVRQSLIGAVILTSVLGISCGLAAPAASNNFFTGGKPDGWPRFSEVLFFCSTTMFASSVGGWLTAGLFSGVYSASVAGTVAGMLLRLFLPLGALAWLGSVDPALLNECGAGRLLVLLYMVMLLTYTLLHVRMHPSRSDSHFYDHTNTRRS